MLGANGAGKSTLMATLAGLLRPWEGRIVLDGQDITDVPAEERPALGVALAPEGRGIFTTLSIEENLLMGATSLKRRFGAAEAKQRTAESLERVYDDVPRARRAPQGPAAASSPAGSSRCSRSGARSPASRRCC